MHFGAFWHIWWCFLAYFGTFWCIWGLFIPYSRRWSQCFGDFYREFSIKSLFSRSVSLVLGGEGAIRTGNFSSILCFPGLFLWFQLVKGRFVPGIFHQFFVFPVLFFGFSWRRGDSYRDLTMKSFFSRFTSLISNTFTFIIFYSIIFYKLIFYHVPNKFYHILHKLIDAF